MTSARRGCRAVVTALVLTLTVAACGGPGVDARVVSDAAEDLSSDPPTDVPPLPTGLEDPLYPDLGAPGMDVAHYDVALTVDDTFTASGTVTITIEATEDLSQVAVDARSLAVSAVTLDGDPVEFTQVEPELLVTPEQVIADGTTFELAVTYVDDPTINPEADQLGPGWIRADGYSYTVNEPEATRDWLPSLDHPSDKATWRFAVTPPDGAIAVANGLPETRPDEGDAGPWVWEVDQPMATYLAQVLVGDWRIVEAPAVDGVRRISALLADDVDDHEALLDGIDAQVAFLQEAFGPYPFATYGIAVVDEEIGLAIEQQTRSLFSPEATTASVAVHELAHQWFGDAVTPDRWADVWLAESFATYAQWLWDEEQGTATVDEQAQAALEARNEDGGPPTDDPTVDTLFGFNVYEGGAVVVQALRREIGDEDFFVLLRSWIADNSGTSRTTEDFTALASEVAGRDLTGFFTTWLSATELPAELPA
ncbi:M1 family metallopeptidase [soil metagenome]